MFFFGESLLLCIHMIIVVESYVSLIISELLIGSGWMDRFQSFFKGKRLKKDDW